MHPPKYLSLSSFYKDSKVFVLLLCFQHILFIDHIHHKYVSFVYVYSPNLP